MLALELSRLGNRPEANRVFGARLVLMIARRTLEGYVEGRSLGMRFRWVPPELLAAAYLVRARAAPQDEQEERTHARWTDVLGGTPLRALAAYPVGIAPVPERSPGEAPPRRLPRPWSAE